MSADGPRDYPNPYVAGTPVSVAEMFFGREDVLAFIRQNLIGRHSDHPLVLYGQRRTGKTSVLYQLRQHLKSEYGCVLIDLHGLNLDGLGNLMRGIATAISAALRRDHQVTVEVPERSAFLADPASAFERAFLDRVWAALGDKRLLLMLDEVGRLDEEMRAGRLDRGVFEYFRHLIQHYERLSLVFSLGGGIEEISGGYAFLFSASVYHQISFLGPSAARDLITYPAHGHYELTDQAIERILQITSGHPYYTQLICHRVFDAWARSPAPVIEVSDVEGILAEAIDFGSANLNYVWNDSSPAERAVMAGIATAAQGIGAAVNADQIREVLSSAGIDVPAHEIVQALRGLTRREVITDSDGYSFAVDLQRLWVNKYRAVERVKEELADSGAPWGPAAPRATATAEESGSDARARNRAAGGGNRQAQQSDRQAKVEQPLDPDEPDLLLSVYVPNERLYAAEQRRVLTLFRDWLARTRRHGVRESERSTVRGSTFEFYADSWVSLPELQAEIDVFARFLDRCADAPATAIDMLAETEIAPATAADLVARFSKEVRRVQLDVRHAREQRMLVLRHTLEEELVESNVDLRTVPAVQLDAILDKLVPHPNAVSLSGLAAPPAVVAPNSSVTINQKIYTAMEQIVIDSVQGTVHLGPQAKDILALIDRFGGDSAAALTAAVHEIEDPDVAPDRRQAAKRRLKQFLAQLTGKAEDIALGVLEKYLESKIGI